MKFQQLLSFSSVATITSAHTIFTNHVAGGTTNTVGYAIRDPSYDGPITDVTSNYIACNGGSNPTIPSPDVVNVAAGSTVQAVWRHTLTGDATDVVTPPTKAPCKPT
jgi:lytic cellulose monooxygenase (C1-hydroxylating)